MQASMDKVWTRTQKQLKNVLNEETYKLWFTSIKPVALNQTSITLEVPNDFSEVWLKDNYLQLLQDSLGATTGRKLNIKFQVTPGASVPVTKGPKKKTTRKTPAAKTNEGDLVFNPKSENSYLYLAKIFNKTENIEEEENNLKNVLLF